MELADGFHGGYPRTRPRQCPRPGSRRSSSPSTSGRPAIGRCSVARSLAEHSDVPVELLTVSSPNVADDVDAYELSRRARDHGWPDAACTIVHDDNPARGIVDHLAQRDGALLVMAADKRPLRTRVLGNIGEEVLRTASSPSSSWARALPRPTAATTVSLDAADCRRRRGRPSRRGTQPGRGRASRPRGVLAAASLDPCRPARRVRRRTPADLSGQLRRRREVDRVPHRRRHEAGRSP